MDQPAYMRQDFNPGGIQDRHDSRDFHYDEIGAAAAPFDWEKGYDIEIELRTILAPKDQNGSLSCGGQAWAMLAAIQEALATGSYEERSAKYIYAQTHVPGFGGSMGRDNSEVARKQGVAREAVQTSYEGGMPPSEAFMTRGQDITEAARADAKSDRSKSYWNQVLDIDRTAQAIAQQGGVILGVNGENNGTWTAMFPQAPKNYTWRHWIYAGKAKLINGKKYIGVLNSWGAQVGQNGWQWIGEDYFATDNIFAVWGMTYNPDPAPTGYTHHFDPAVPLHYRSENEEIKALQIALRQDGEFPDSVPTTGYYGNITRQAVLAFQRKYNVAPSSVLDALQGRTAGPKTLEQLNKLFDL